MRLLWILLTCFILGGIYFYNTDWFQSTFMYNRYYQSICDVDFDVTKKGESISIPLTFKYRTCYHLAVTVPDKNVFHDRLIGPGVLTYRFVSEGKILKEGKTNAPSRHKLGLNHGVSRLYLLVFDLPYPGQRSDLTLELEVLEPFVFLTPYVGNIRCRIGPAYNAKVGRCIGE